MSDCIERMRVLQEFQKIGGCGAAPGTWSEGWDKAIDAAYNRILGLPAADVALVERAHWIEQDGMQICPKCGEEHTWDDFRAAYCDCCGAKMEV